MPVAPADGTVLSAISSVTGDGLLPLLAFATSTRSVVPDGAVMVPFTFTPYATTSCSFATAVVTDGAT